MHLKGSACKCVGVLGYYRRGYSSVSASWISEAGLLTCMDVFGILGEFAQVCRRLGYAGRVGSNTWRALGISGAHLAAKLILKRGEINLKSNDF